MRKVTSVKGRIDSKRSATVEFLGTAILLAAVVGSGIMAERLSGGNVAIALLANTIATGAALFFLIVIFGPVSGAHFNPAVTIFAGNADASWRMKLLYIAAQIAGGIGGVVIANLMFGLPAINPSTRARFGVEQWLSETVAAFGLVLVILGSARLRSAFAVPLCVAAYITSAYWFTASTSFANPAVTIARSLSDSFAGIRPLDAPAFVAAQLLGAGCASVLGRWLFSENNNNEQ